MTLLLTTNGRLVKNNRGEYFTSVVYSYSFFERYLEVFDSIKLVAHCEELEQIPEGYLRVDGEKLSVIEIPFPHGKVDYVKKFLSVKKAIKEKLKNTDFDVAILRIPEQLSFQVFKAIKNTGKPIGAEIVSSSWDIMAPDVSSSPLRPFIRVIWDYNEKKICREADGTAYVTKDFLQKRYVPCTDKKHFTTSYSSANVKKALTEPKNYSDAVKTAIHVSADIGGNVKGHLELVQAMAKLKSDGIKMNAVIVGSGELALNVTQVIKENSLEDSIRLTGRLNKEQLAEEYKNADLFVFPSYREGLPRVVIEAMTYALPVVATDIPGIRELVNPDSLIPVKDSQALYEKLKLFLKDNELLKAKSKENLENSANYTSDVLQKKRNEFFENLISLIK